MAWPRNPPRNCPVTACTWRIQARFDNFDRWSFALSLLSSDQDAVYEIEEALKRIEKKTYGVCELTGKTIPKARLAKAIPWTRFTVEAQGQLERDGALRSRRLGQLGTIDSAGANEVESDDDEPEEKAKEKGIVFYGARNHHHRMHGSAQGREVPVPLHHDPQQEIENGKAGD